MQQIFNILSKVFSILLYPLFMPTYGMGLYMLAMHHRTPNLPNAYIWVAIVGTLVITALIPIVLLLILWKRGNISSLHIDNAKERTTPYVYSLICYGFWCYFVGVTLHMPLVWLVVAIGSTCALLAVTIINHWWKISAHLTGMGGLLGGICSLALYYSALPTTLIIITLTISLLLMYARLYMNAHTPAQVVAGYLLGILFTFIPNLILHHA
jgi:membrane-associated phospholipid phosphatase